MPSQSVLIHKLQQALNQNGLRIMYSTSQFYSEQQDRPITIYHIKQAVWDSKKGKWVNQELFNSPAQLHIVFYLRDMWYSLTGRELPTDNEKWNAIRAKLQE
jgi:hypothetical protein